MYRLLCVNFLVENFQAGQYYIRLLCIKLQLVRIESIKTVDTSDIELTVACF